jgi:hypothetical protein
MSTGAADTDSKTAQMAVLKVVPAPNSRLLGRFVQMRQVLRDTPML